jgi:Putative transposase, YhgA-like
VERLLGYLTEISTRHHKDHGFPLPPVLPFVFHQGPQAWHLSTQFESLFELPEDLAASLLPFLPRFQHALLDLTRCDPTNEESDAQLRVVLQLMKLARQKELLRFFHWLAQIQACELPDNLLSLMLLYALYSDSDLDAKRIYHSLATYPELEKNIMSVAEKLKAEGRVQGQQKGLWIGKIQAFEEFLTLPPTPSVVLSSFTMEQLETRHQELHQAYEIRFKH